MRSTVLLMAALSSVPALGQQSLVLASQIWSDTVKRGDMIREVRGLGTVKGRRTVELQIAKTKVKEIRADQQVSIDIREGKPLVGRSLRSISPS
jgi:translation initiation factor IF-2